MLTPDVYQMLSGLLRSSLERHSFEIRRFNQASLYFFAAHEFSGLTGGQTRMALE